MGVLCGSCDDEYYKSSWITCTHCSDWNTVQLRAILQVVWLTILIESLVYLSVDVACTNNQYRLEFLGLIKLMINHSVFLRAIDNINFKWSQAVQVFITGQRYVINQLARNIAFMCFLMGPKQEHDADFQTYYKHLILACTSPLWFFIWCTSLFLVRSCLLRERGPLKGRIVGYFMTITWLFLPDIAHAVASSVSCIEING